MQQEHEEAGHVVCVVQKKEVIKDPSPWSGVHTQGGIPYLSKPKQRIPHRLAQRLVS